MNENDIFLLREDYEQLEKFIKMSNLIKEIYDELYVLEVNYQKDSKEYNTLMQELKEMLKEEKALYDETNLNLIRSKAIITYLLNSDEIPSEIELAICNNSDSCIEHRIVNKLYERINYANSSDIFSPLIDNDLAKKAFDMSYSMNKSFYIDAFNNYLYFLNTSIQNDKLMDIKEDLIKNKYLSSFLISNIEKNLVSNNFNISDKIYISSKMTSDMMNLDRCTYNILKNKYSQMIVNRIIVKLLNKNDKYYLNKNNYTCLILSRCMIRSLFLLMDAETINEVNFQFHELIESDMYLNDHLNDQVSIRSIIDCFKKNKSDNNKKQVLSLK